MIFKNKTFKIITFGCRVNQAESRMMAEQLVQTGWQFLDSKKQKQADLVIINTCAVTHKAEREVRKEIRRAKRENPHCFLIAAGCWVEALKKEDNLNLMKKIDLLIKNQGKKDIQKIIQEKLNQNYFLTNLGSRISHKKIFKDKYGQSKKALIKIQTGCNNFCAYCLVPYLRGHSQSYPTQEIIQEINQQLKNGIEEIILTGVDIADYHFQSQPFGGTNFSDGNFQANLKNDLVKLLKLILLKTKIKKISFGSINLKAFDREFIDFYQKVNLEKLSTHFHIPLQSGCQATLKRMKRKYTVRQFIKTIKRLKKEIFGFSFSTDLILGFPGETEEEFKQTLETIKTLKLFLGKSFIKIHLFRYSPRLGTLAAKMRGRKGWEIVPAPLKKQRLKKINELFS